MIKKNIHQVPHYMPLIGILVISAYGFYIFSYDKLFQMAISIAAATSYIMWGVVHHFIKKDFSLEIFIEYVSVAILGLIMIFSVILRS